MIHKEIIMNFIAYNCVHTLMYETAEKAELHGRKVSFKGGLQAIHRWSPQFNREKLSSAERSKLLNDLYGAVTSGRSPIILLFYTLQFSLEKDKKG